MKNGHQITVEPCQARVVVTLAGATIADSRRALALREGAIRPIYYIPRADVAMDHLTRTDHATHCPFKGDACHFTIRVGDTTAENAAWSYEDPKDEVAAIKDHLAFYESKVDAIAVE